MLVVESMMRTPTVCVPAGTGNLELTCDIAYGTVGEVKRVGVARADNEVANIPGLNVRGSYYDLQSLLLIV